MNGLLGCGRCVAGGGVRVRRPTASSWRLLKWKVNIERACVGMAPRTEGWGRGASTIAPGRTAVRGGSVSELSL